MTIRIVSGDEACGKKVSSPGRKASAIPYYRPVEQFLYYSKQVNITSAALSHVLVFHCPNGADQSGAVGDETSLDSLWH